MSSKVGHPLLRALLEDGTVPATRMSAAAEKVMANLFKNDVGILRRERSGAGVRIVVARPVDFQAYVEREHPGALLGEARVDSPRAEGIRRHGDSKSLGGTLGEPVLLRGGLGTFLVAPRDMKCLMAAESFGGHSFVLREGASWRLQGPRACLGLVENIDVFLSLDVMAMGEALGLDAIVWTHGRMSDRFLGWLNSPEMAGMCYLHLGDYDPVGLEEYLRLGAVVSSYRTRLYLPPDLPGFFKRQSKRHLLAKEGNLERFQSLRARGSEMPEDARQVLDQMREWNGCVEHEALLVEAWPEGVPDPFLRG